MKGALALELIVDQCAADHAELYKVCRAHVDVQRMPPIEDDQRPHVEVCLICRKGFATRLAWASHAARLHGYRNAAAKLCHGSVCRGCGKVYANPGRLKRHVEHSAACRQQWWCFLPRDADATAHPRMPPQRAPGSFAGDPLPASELDDCAALLDALSRLVPCTVDGAMSAIQSCIRCCGSMEG